MTRALHAWRWISGHDGIALSLLIALAGFLRLYHLGTNPPGLFCDEASIACNAESLGRTGRDLDGAFLPLRPCDPSYEAWGFPGGIAYAPLYSYAMIPAIRLMGRSPMVVRFPSVVFGLLGILGLFLLARHLLGRRVAYLSAVMLAVLPWHVGFSRVAFEAISILPPIGLGCFLLFKGLGDSRLLVAGAATICLAAYAYPLGIAWAPLLLGGFIAFHWRLLRDRGPGLACALSAAAILLLPWGLGILGNVHQERARSLWIGLADLGQVPAVITLQELSPRSTVATLILAHRSLLVAYVFGANYLSYLSPGFLFLWGDSNLRHNPAGMGLCLRVMAPLLVMGVATLWKRRTNPADRFLLYFLIAFPIPPSLAVESPHAIRSLPGVLILALVCAVGAERLWSAARAALARDPAARWTSRAAVGLLGAVLLLFPYEAIVYLRLYHGEYPVQSAAAWQAGMGEAIQWLEREKNAYEQVNVSPHLFNSCILVLFYADTDLRTLPASRDVNDRLRPYRYRILFGDEGGARHRRNLWLFPASERARYGDLPVIREFPFPDGSANLLVARSGS